MKKLNMSVKHTSKISKLVAIIDFFQGLVQ